MLSVTCYVLRGSVNSARFVSNVLVNKAGSEGCRSLGLARTFQDVIKSVWELKGSELWVMVGERGGKREAGSFGGVLESRYRSSC